MRLLLALVIAVLLLGSALADEKRQAGSKNFAGRVDVTATFRALYPRTFAVLRERFPADYAILLGRLAEIDQQPGDGTVRLLTAFQRLGDIRFKHAGRLLFAPGLQLSVVLGRIAEFHDAVLARDGPGVCGRFASDGSAVLFELGIESRYAEALDLQSHAFFEAVAAANAAPDHIGAVTADDWGVVMGAMLYAGAPPSYVETIRAGDPGDPDLCPALAAMFRTSGLLQSPEGLRTRADFARNLTGY